MSLTPPPPARPGPVIYPDSDGEPMSDNTKQGRWIVVFYGNFSAMYRLDANVFVAANNLWYPVEGEPEVRAAPDVYVVFGRPKGDRGSYKQWEEGDVPLTVAVEIRSPKNTDEEMDRKRLFYEEHGVEEYYYYDPETNRLEVYVRRGSVLARVRPLEGFVSPRLGIHFDFTGPEMVVYRPDGRPFLTFEEIEHQRQLAEQRAEDERKRAEDERKRAEDERKRAEDERKRAEDERKRADEAVKRAEDAVKERKDAEQRAEDERRRADDERRRAADERKRADDAEGRSRDERRRADRAEQRAARLTELGRKARRGLATAEELAELERLEGEPPEAPG